jgi:hypothetical protein
MWAISTSFASLLIELPLLNHLLHCLHYNSSILLLHPPLQHPTVPMLPPSEITIQNEEANDIERSFDINGS